MVERKRKYTYIILEIRIGSQYVALPHHTALRRATKIKMGDSILATWHGMAWQGNVTYYCEHSQSENCYTVLAEF